MKTLWKLLRYFVSDSFTAIAGLASIIGVLYLLFAQKTNTIIALLLFIIFLIIILTKFILLANSFVSQKTKSGHLKLVNYVRYSTMDGKLVHYETHRYIQSKSLIIDEYVHLFVWSGTKSPKISSTQQKFVKLIRAQGDADLDKAIFKFKKPLIYNEFAIVEIIMDIDDSNYSSKPYCAQVINEAIQLISYSIELKHLANNNNALIQRKIMGARVDQEYETLYSIPFDEKSRSYHYNLFHPELGYNYRIYWGQ